MFKGKKKPSFATIVWKMGGSNMTEVLYMHDIGSCYIFDFKAKVVDSDPIKGSVVLDRTAFYPEGGGQPTDTGWISWDKGRSKVSSIKKTDEIRHYLEGAIPLASTKVECQIDTEKRYNHMRMHTSQHLISAIAWKHFSARTVGNQIYSDRSHMDLKPASLKDLDIDLIKEEVTRMISEDQKVTIIELDRDVIESTIGTERVDLSRLPRHISKLRTVLIGNDGSIDLCPCAGTHVRSLSELKGIRSLIKWSKGAEKTRIEYTLM